MAEVSPYVQDWASLTTRRAGATLFSGLRFRKALAECFPAQGEWFGLALRADDELVSFAPLVRSRNHKLKLPYRELHFFRNQHTICNHLLLPATDDTAAVSRHLRVWARSCPLGWCKIGGLTPVFAG